MPKPGVVFRPSFASEEDESDDDIVIIPYTKPPPVVIDLLESDCSDSSSSKRSPKKKSKKKRSKRERERSKSCGSTNVASLGENADKISASSPVVASTVSQQSTRPLDDGDDDIEEIICDQVGEPINQPSSEVGRGSANVVTKSNISLSGTSSTSVRIHDVLDERSASTSSCLETSSNTQSSLKNAEVGQRTETGGKMVGTPSTPGSAAKSAKSKERKARGQGKSRTRTMSATQRTNEEIVNFLTTLGIQMEASAFDTPVTRRRQPRKRQADVTPTGEGISHGSPSVIGSNEQTIVAAPSCPGAFVSVTQESSTPVARRDSLEPKKKRKRQAISGDISDYTITFTNKDLNSISTNIQSNVILPNNGSRGTTEGFITLSSSKGLTKTDNTPASSSSKQRQNYYDEVIDAVARGLEFPVQLPTAAEGNKDTNVVPQDNLGNKDLSTETNQLETPIETGYKPNPSSINEIVKDAKTPASREDHKDTFNTSNEKIPVPSTLVQTSTEKLEVNKGSDAVQNVDTIQEVAERVEPHGGEPKNAQVTGVLSDAATTTGTKEDFVNQNNQHGISSKEDNKRKYSPPRSSLIGNQSGPAKTSPEANRHKLNNSPATARIAANRLATEVRERSAEKVAFQCQNPVGVTSQSEPYFPTTWSGHMKDFYGASRDENLELEDVLSTMNDSMQVWKASRDIMPPPKIKRRVRCERCKQFGHLVRECTEKKKPLTCHYCGENGHSSDHYSRHTRTCPNAKCLNCGHKTSNFTQKCSRCLLRSRPPRCEICNVSGHEKELCPDNWRRYHSITSSDEYEKLQVSKSSMSSQEYKEHLKNRMEGIESVYKSPSAMYCSNCGRRSHSYYDCPRSKFNPYPRNKPFIIREARINEIDAANGPNAIPISYDSRTGRTVVVNSEANRQPALTVETIQVKITNELAMRERESDHAETRPVDATTNVLNTRPTVNYDGILQPSAKLVRSISDSNSRFSSSVSGNRRLCENSRCKNMLRDDEKCCQTIMDVNAHLKLLRDYNKGYVRPLEVRFQVQISVLNDGCKVHICGSSALEAEQELLRNLRQRINMRNSNQLEDSAKENCFYQTNSRDMPTSMSVNNNDNNCSRARTQTCEVLPVFLIDEEDDCSVIAEVAARKPENMSRNAARNTTERQREINSTTTSDSIEAFLLDRGASKDQVEASIADDNTAIPSSSSAAWLEYVSPLTGIPMNFDLGGSGGSNKEDEKSTTANATMMHDTTSERPPTPNSSMNDSFDCEEFDYSDLLSTYAPNQTDPCGPSETDERRISRMSASNDALPPAPPVTVSNEFEIITLDDLDDDQDDSQNGFGNYEEKVALIPSEWNLTVTEFAKQNSIIKQIAQEFDVTIIVSKETSSILIRNGGRQALKLAKDEVVYWLEARCLNMEYHFVRRRNLQAKGMQQNQNPEKWKKKRSNRKPRNRSHTPQKNKSFGTPSSSSSSSTSTTSVVQSSSSSNQPNFTSLSASPSFTPRRESKSFSFRKMQQQKRLSANTNKGKARYPIPSSQMYNRTPQSRSRYFHN